CIPDGIQNQHALVDCAFGSGVRLRDFGVPISGAVSRLLHVQCGPVSTRYRIRKTRDPLRRSGATKRLDTGCLAEDAGELMPRVGRIPLSAGVRAGGCEQIVVVAWRGTDR